MGIPGLLKEIGKGERVSLTKLAVEHFEKTSRPLRIAIDATIWQFQHQAGQGGKNPALRTLFFRLLRLLALPIHPVFVYDGKNKPKTKRGKTVTRYGTSIDNELSKNLIGRFSFPFHTAPGEAEAECAFLQKHGLVDAVMSQDVDAIMFGSGLTFRDWSKEGTKGNKAPTHVNVLDAVRIHERTGLNSDGMILVALLSGGDYDEGLPGFGPTLACQIAKAGFAVDLLNAVRQEDTTALREWRARLTYELQTNESGYFTHKHKSLAIPNSFPDREILLYYLEPAISDVSELKTLERRWSKWWTKEIDVSALRLYTAVTFDWMYKAGAKNFIRKLAQPLLQHRLKLGVVRADAFTTAQISEHRQHFTTDGLSELRLEVVPNAIVELDLNAEDENPEFADLSTEAEDNDLDDEEISSTQEPAEPLSPSKKSRRLPWDPFAVEKWWIPQSLLQYGLPVLVEDWQQEERDARSDPKLFAMRRCAQRLRQANLRKKPHTGAESVMGTSSNPGIKAFFSVSRQIDEVAYSHSNTGGICGPREDIVSKQRTPNDRRTSDSYEDEVSSSDPRISTNVTHRKRRSPDKSRLESEVSIPNGQPVSKQTKNLLNFFTSGQEPRPRSGRVEPSNQKGVKRAAVARDSMPGTWKEASHPVSGKPRVSYIDLTDD